jgi:TRAP-type uncharacterized transport system fused permease subunit
VYATLSPPVAESVLAAAKIAREVWDTGNHAMKLAATTFIIPFAFVFNPELMAFPNFSWKMLGASRRGAHYQDELDLPVQVLQAQP